MTSSISNRGTVTEAERTADGIVGAARAAVGDLLLADPRGVVFGRSATELTFHLARTLAKDWSAGDEIVVSRLDHDANIRPWIIAAQGAGATVRWVEFDAESGELAPADVAAVLSDRTRLLALTGASNLIGTRPDLPAIAEIVHAADGLFWVDGVHATAHIATDMKASGADFWVCSPYKFLGPHLGALAAAPELLETLRPDKLLPSSDAVPERFELGTLPYELLAGTTAAVDFLAALAGPNPSPQTQGQTRREHLVTSFAAIEEHEDALLDHLDTQLRELPGVRVYSNARSRTPTVLFTAEGHDPQAIRSALAQDRISAPAGHFYAWECSRHLGLGAAGGVRVGLAPYTDADEVDRLVVAVKALL